MSAEKPPGESLEPNNKKNEGTPNVPDAATGSSDAPERLVQKALPDLKNPFDDLLRDLETDIGTPDAQRIPTQDELRNSFLDRLTRRLSPHNAENNTYNQETAQRNMAQSRVGIILSILRMYTNIDINSLSQSSDIPYETIVAIETGVANTIPDQATAYRFQELILDELTSKFLSMIETSPDQKLKGLTLSDWQIHTEQLKTFSPVLFSPEQYTFDQSLEIERFAKKMMRDLTRTPNDPDDDLYDFIKKNLFKRPDSPPDEQTS